MNILKISLACLMATTLAGHVNAEIYQSKDAQGNPVFTDTPTSGSEAVDLRQTNTADAPPDIPEAPPEAAPKPRPASSPGQQEEGNVIIIGNDHNERLEDDIIDHRRHEVLDGEKVHEVGDGENIGERELPEQVPEHVEGARPKAHPHVGVRKR